MHRLRGEFAAAEAAYREAHRGGYEPQPGLALLRLAQGNGEAAVAAIRRLARETSDQSRRAALLPAEVEIMLAVGDVPAARGACEQLEQLAAQWDSAMIGASAAHARGAVALEDGQTDPRSWRCERPHRPGGAWRHRTRRRARRCSSASRAGHSAMRTPPPWSSVPREKCWRNSARHRTSVGSTPATAPAAGPRPHPP